MLKRVCITRLSIFNFSFSEKKNFSYKNSRILNFCACVMLLCFGESSFIKLISIHENIKNPFVNIITSSRATFTSASVSVALFRLIKDDTNGTKTLFVRQLPFKQRRNSWSSVIKPAKLSSGH